MSKGKKKKESHRQRQQQDGNGAAARQPPDPPKRAAQGGNDGMATVTAAGAAREHRYNDDLLAAQADQDAIKQLYPDLFHVLDHPELRRAFTRYNDRANTAKSRVHCLGLFAIALATLALLSSAMTPILNGILEIKDLDAAVVNQIEIFKDYSIYAEIAGLLGAGIALGGLWIATWKKEWLESRLMTERLRAWHFQMLNHRGKEIEDSCRPDDQNALRAFQEKRALWFTAFIHQHDGAEDSVLHELIEAPEACYMALHDGSSEYSEANSVLERVFEAYKSLRLKHQAYYASHKLQKFTNQPLWKPHKWPINVLNARLTMITSACIVGALTVSAYIVLGHFCHWPMAHSVALPAIILCFLVLNVATRGVLDGLAVREEVQRYTDYAGEVRYLLTRFEASHDRDERLRIMRDMERAAVEELKGFLRSHSEARFVL